MSANSDKLATALNTIPFVQVVEHEQQGSAISLLCRIRPHYGTQWAALAESILREAIKRQGTSESWHTHIARTYMIRDNALVYGWTFMIVSQAEGSLNIVCQILAKAAQVFQENGQIPPVTASARNNTIDLPKNDEDYTEPTGPLVKGAVPEADERGNPIVPRKHRVETIPMAGMDPNYDRNAPDPEKGKGSWHIESRKGKPFRPPIKRN